jgi:hypothetical protein
MANPKSDQQARSQAHSQTQQQKNAAAAMQQSNSIMSRLTAANEACWIKIGAENARAFAFCGPTVPVPGFSCERTSFPV